MNRIRIAVYAAASLVVCLFAVALLRGFGFRFDPFDTREKAVAAAASATEQAASATEAVHQIDHFDHETKIIRERADDAVAAIQASSGASDPLPDDVRELWLAGLHDSAGSEPDSR